MEKKVSMSTFLIIVGIIVIGVLSCYLVILIQTKSNIELEKKQLEENMVKIQEQVQTLQKENKELQDKIDIITNTITNKNTEVDKATQTEQKNEGIKVEKEEFSLTLPKSWEGKYEIRVRHEETDMKYYNFVSTANINLGADGSIFTVAVKPLEQMEYIPEMKYVNIIEDMYLYVTTPSDVTFSDNKEAMKEYQEMAEDVKDIINTIKIKK